MYTYDDGQWGVSGVSTKIDLEHYGFKDYTDMVCRLGPLQYYSRYSTGEKFQFEFLVKLYMGSMAHGSYWVWLKSLPSLIQLFKELDVHPAQDITDPAYALIDYLRDETHFAEALEIMYKTLKKQQEAL